jgi:hypothetical protein
MKARFLLASLMAAFLIGCGEQAKPAKTAEQSEDLKAIRQMMERDRHEQEEVKRKQREREETLHQQELERSRADFEKRDRERERMLKEIQKIRLEQKGLLEAAKEQLDRETKGLPKK